jgi:hypothetical protein
MAWVRAWLIKLQKKCTRLAAASDKVYQLLAHGWWFSPGTPASSTTIYRTRDEQANRYAIDVVLDDLVLFNKIVDMKYNVHDPFLE